VNIPVKTRDVARCAANPHVKVAQLFETFIS